MLQGVSYPVAINASRDIIGIFGVDEAVLWSPSGSVTDLRPSSGLPGPMSNLLGTIIAATLLAMATATPSRILGFCSRRHPLHTQLPPSPRRG